MWFAIIIIGIWGCAAFASKYDENAIEGAFWITLLIGLGKFILSIIK